MPNNLIVLTIEKPEEMELCLYQADASVIDECEIIGLVDYLIATYFKPAESYLIGSDIGDFDMDKAANQPIPGLLLSGLQEQFPTMSHDPSDEELKCALEATGINIDTSKARRDFYITWRAWRADRIVNAALTYLFKQREALLLQPKIKSWLEFPLPAITRVLVEALTACP